MENMLSNNKVLREFICGPLAEIFQRLNGANGKELLIALKRFLRGENPWNKKVTEFLKFEACKEDNLEVPKNISERFKNIFAKLLILVEVLGYGDFLRELSLNQLNILTSSPENIFLEENIIVAEEFIKTTFIHNPGTHSASLYKMLEFYPANWQEIFNEFEKNSLKISYKEFFSSLNEEISALIAKDHLSFMEENIYKKIDVSGISKLKPSLLDSYTEFILRPDNLKEFDEKFNYWHKFLILAKYQEKNKVEKTFRSYWNFLDEERRDQLIKYITYSNSERRTSDSYDCYKEIFSVFDNYFSNEFKAELANYFDFGYGITAVLDPHIYWVPKLKRLEYLKNKTPINNTLCYTLFDKNKPLLKEIGTEKEIISFKEVKELVNYYKEKYGRDACYVREAINFFEKWVKNNPDKIS